ncbi:MAG: hypothetical protein ACP5RH_21520, partial [Leptodesmis sp.]|uniref:hypothetical protein n=1 Tax=Leptodesmis sp. TaxID=3100501 RepID=UPI003D0E8D15
RSRFSQSSRTSNHPRVAGARPTAMVIGLKLPDQGMSIKTIYSEAGWDSCAKAQVIQQNEQSLRFFTVFQLYGSHSKFSTDFLNTTYSFSQIA